MRQTDLAGTLKVLALVILASWSNEGSAQQAFTITQYNQNVTAYNTAYSLVTDVGSINILGRRQLIGIEGAPTTLALTASYPIKPISGSVGVIVLHDQIAVEKLTEASLFIGKAVQLSERNYLSVSFNGGIRSYDARYSDLDPFDPDFHEDVRDFEGTVGLGVMLFEREKYYIGASLPRLSLRTLGKASSVDRDVSNWYYFNAGYYFDFFENFGLSATSIVLMSGHESVQANLGAMLLLNKQIGAGMNFGTNRAIAGVLSYHSKSNMTFGYSYETSVNNGLNRARNGATHEISIGYQLGGRFQPRVL